MPYHACAKPRVSEDNNVRLFPASKTLGERSRKEGEDSEREKSKSVLSTVGGTARFAPSLIQAAFFIQKDKVKLKEGKKLHKKHSVLDEEIASDSDAEE